MNFLEIDNQEVKNNQLKKLKKVKNTRNENEVVEILNELSLAAKEKNKNLLAL